MATRDLPLLCHWNGDGDIARAWLEHYTELGVTEFHIVLHGPRRESEEFLAASADFPVVIRDHYEAPYDHVEQARRLTTLLRGFVGRWVLVVDSDEFVELPISDWTTLAWRLELFGQTYLFAPFIQRFRADGTLETPRTIVNPFDEMPMCDPDLSLRLGLSPMRRKFPLILVDERSVIHNGNHRRPNETKYHRLYLGATHHFKWKRSLIDRLEAVIALDLDYADDVRVARTQLEALERLIPLDHAFEYSRQAMFDRGHLKGPTVNEAVRRLAHLGGVELRRVASRIKHGMYAGA